jgi:hypothetical protein
MFDEVKHPVFEVKAVSASDAAPELTLQAISDSKVIRLHRHSVGDSLDFVQNFLELLEGGYRLDTDQGREMLKQFAAAMRTISDENAFFTKAYREVINHLESRNIEKQKEGSST